jgi:hypothetical protein
MLDCIRERLCDFEHAPLGQPQQEQLLQLRLDIDRAIEDAKQATRTA